ncbi:outer membrane protein assembly factor BamB family protein [Alienimonas californiensis]|uniref:Outer membrane biogenesis protein BamB n=1 Tax=Alienimonas californiensis TaxID=2527989 RepID=A0A517PF90_9PLAN|nr:PQQ-binding-like beta-propeller repeat protein [Alienimonas californiensis]QDT18036.1 outer membrane biogenesis protein BamB [Alienimonas californiensis]
MLAAPLLLAALACVAPADVPADVRPVDADQWARFRGPDGAGVAAGTFPDTFTQADFAWTTPLRGTGVSSPAVWGDAVFVTAGDGGKRLLYRVDAATGQVVWVKDVTVNPDGPPAEPSLHAKNDPASATPAADASRVFALFSDGERIVLSAFTHAGEPLWRRDLGPFNGQHGHGTSPVRVDVPAEDAAGAGAVRELLVLTNDQDEEGGVLALDARTGEPVWTAARDSREVAYATPVVLRRPGQPLALLTASGAAGIVALDAATGAELWRTGEFPARVVASPVIAGGKAWAQCGSGGAGKLLIGADLATGDVQVEHTRSLPYVPTPVAANGLLFLWGDRGVVTALNAADGEVVWAERVGGNYSGSPIVIGDKLVCVTEEGVVTVLAADDEYRLLGKTELGVASSATPAVSGGRVVFRLEDRLVCLPLSPAPAR